MASRRAWGGAGELPIASWTSSGGGILNVEVEGIRLGTWKTTFSPIVSDPQGTLMRKGTSWKTRPDTFGSGVSGTTGDVAWAGMEALSTSPYQLAQARLYDGETGRFSSADPIGLAGGPHRFAYAGNSPATFVDPTGLYAQMSLPSPGGDEPIFFEVGRRSSGGGGGPIAELINACRGPISDGPTEGASSDDAKRETDANGASQTTLVDRAEALMSAGWKVLDGPPPADVGSRFMGQKRTESAIDSMQNGDSVGVIIEDADTHTAYLTNIYRDDGIGSIGDGGGGGPSPRPGSRSSGEEAGGPHTEAEMNAFLSDMAQRADTGEKGGRGATWGDVGAFGVATGLRGAWEGAQTTLMSPFLGHYWFKPWSPQFAHDYEQRVAGRFRSGDTAKLATASVLSAGVTLVADPVNLLGGVASTAGRSEAALANQRRKETGALRAAAKAMASKVRASRGVSAEGGIFTKTTNAAGGDVITSVGNITQNDVATHVNSALYNGDVNILSGVHGTPEGLMPPEPSFFASDVARFGDIEGVTVHDITAMSTDEITSVLQSPGTTIGAFCNSGPRLAPYR